MKKLIFTILTLTFLCSCSKTPSTDTSFVHASGLDETEDGVRFSVLLEHQNEKENRYSCISYEGEDPKEAFEKFVSDYPGCYTGSAQICFFGETLSRRSLYECALFMCETPSFPSKSTAVSVSSVTARELLENIKDTDTLKDIKNKCNGKSPALAAFFAMCTNPGTTAKV